MKRFLMFAGDTYYARGGWVDFVADFDTLEEILPIGEMKLHGHADEDPCEWFHIVDTESMKVVYKLGNRYGDYK